ncbi:hypothetical protein [Microbacterium sp. NPDC086615]|uniref:hypothetical protein n=1 Tax=Microbacterium sp. NPDC086615 TaxID=3154865 RepID=UPI0034168213
MGLEISNTTVRITDLVTYSDPAVIDGIRATNVVFMGPAILAILNGTFETQGDCRILGGFEGAFWPLEPGRTQLSGVIGISNSYFENCVFSNIGFAVQDAHAHQFASRFTV